MPDSRPILVRCGSGPDGAASLFTGRRHVATAVARAFTLIEVLVVVAILALLITILLPSLKRAREQAKVLVCRTRLRELYNGHVYYAQESKNYFPHWDWWLWDNRPNDPNIKEPQFKFFPNIYAKTGGTRPTNSTRWVEFGHIYRYVRNKEVYFCPKDPKIRRGNSIGAGGAKGDKPIHSFVRFIEPHDFISQHSGGGLVDEGKLTQADFINPDKLKVGCMAPPLPTSGIPYTTTPDRVGLLFEEYPGFEEDKPIDPKLGNTTNALNDGYSGFWTFDDYLGLRHTGRGHILYWDGHTLLADGTRFNKFQPVGGDRYAAIVAIGEAK